MPHDPDLSPAPFLAALGAADAAGASPVSGGMSTSIWRVERPEGPAALRVFRAGEEGTWRREREAMAAARAAGVPVPELLAAEVVGGRPAMLLGWCQGADMAGALEARPWLVWRLGRAFGRAQAAVHRAAPPPGWPADEWAGAAGDEGLARLLRQLAGPPALLHLDYHPRNVMTDGRSITAVLDWANARAGDPRADLARTLSILVVEPWGPGREPLHLAIARRTLAAAWRSGYAAAGGRADGMAPFYAWAGAVMARDLAWRVGAEGSWWEERHLDRIRRWGARWRRLSRAPLQ